MKPFNLDGSNLGTALAKDRAKRDEVAERRPSMCEFPAVTPRTEAFLHASGGGLGCGREEARWSDKQAVTSLHFRNRKDAAFVLHVSVPVFH
jgi:hypothetical protein